MTGKTISAYTDEKTAHRFYALAEAESRKPAQVAAMALDFYVSLPKEARDLWRVIALEGTKHDVEEAKIEITRALLNVKSKITHRKMMEEIKVDGLENLETEEDFLLKAIELTT